jgi:zinc protease
LERLVLRGIRVSRLLLKSFSAAMLIGTALPSSAAYAQAERTSEVPPINYTSRTLANGLKVYAIRDDSSPNVSVQVWYGVGSKDDPAGRSGFAHLFEHLMFKATRNMVPEQFDRLTEDVGGFNNASTNDDFTNYYEVVPANHLQRLLWAEADRMGSLVVEPTNFASERKVVQEELRSRVLAEPYGKLFYLFLPEISYSVHPYARPGIGSLEDLDAATIDDVRAFHATYYRPDNATLVVAGRFDPAQLNQWVDQYFSPIAQPRTRLPRVTVAEPTRKARSYTVYEPNTPLPAVLVSYPSPPLSADDATVMEVIDAVLSSGRSSRLYQSLVYSQQLATAADTFNDQKKGRGNLAAYAILASGKSAADGEKALRREIARLRDAPVSAAELQEAKNELLSAALRERETVDGKASAIAEAVVLRGSAAAANRRFARIASTTPADIQRVARKYLTDAQSSVVRYLPEQPGAKGDTIAVPATVRAAKLVAPANIKIVEPASDAERIAPPPPAAEVATVLPTPVTQKLANGMTVITVPRRALPLATAVLVSNHGAATDPQGKAGLARMTSQLLIKGTKTRSATQIAQEVEALGGSISSEASFDGAVASMQVKSDQLAPALAILSDVARNPVFAPEEIERQRTNSIDQVQVAMQQPGAVASIVGNCALFGPGFYGQPLTGTPQSLKSLTRNEIVAKYGEVYRPSNSTLVLTGDVTPEQSRALAERYFGDWTASAAAPPQPAAKIAAPGRVVLVDMPGAGQAAVGVFKEGLRRSDPRFYPTLVANAVLGAGYSSRLNQELRIKRGLTYGAGSSIDARRSPGPFSASTQTKNPSAAEVLGLILGEMTRLGAQPISAAELGTRQAVLNGSFGRQLETTSGLAQITANYVLQGVDPSEVGRFQQSVLAVTPQQAGAAARELLSPVGATIVIVGDSRAFLDQIRKSYPDVTVVPLKDLRVENLPSR